MNSMGVGPGRARAVLRSGRSGVASVGPVALINGFSALEFEIQLIAWQEVRRDGDFLRH